MAASWLVFFATFVLTLGGCELIDTSGYYRAAGSYEHENAVVDAREIARRHDLKIYSAMGYAFYFPGLDPEVGHRLAERFGPRSLPGTGDEINGDTKARSGKAAATYASAYEHETVTIPRSSGAL